MPAFAAINLEPEENLEDEVNTVKELQVDEALKQFQAALKLHAQGPQFFDEAADAYDVLFESEIFKFPESKTEFERFESDRRCTGTAEQSLAPGPEAVAGIGEVDGLANSLPQTLYLSHKNHAQFIIDRIRSQARNAERTRSEVFRDPEVIENARKALNGCSTALDWDPSDAELWRKTARLAAFLKSTRISRYCLEAAVELDDDPAAVEVEPPSLAEGFAGIQLKRLLQTLDDDMAISHPIMRTFRDRALPPLLQRHLDPIPFLPDPTQEINTGDRPLGRQVSSPRAVVVIANFSWADLGLALVKFVLDSGPSGQAVTLELPELPGRGDEDVQVKTDRQNQLCHGQSKSEDVSDTAKIEDLTTSELLGKSPSPKEPSEVNGESMVPADSASKEKCAASSVKKRSHSAAGLAEPTEEENDIKRSKRTRRRETAAEEIMDPATRLATQLQPYQAADKNLFQTTKNILENLGVTDKVTLDRVATILDSCATDDRWARISDVATTDLRDLMVNFEEDLAKKLLHKKQSPELDLSTLLEHTMSNAQRSTHTPAFEEARGLIQFVERANSSWLTVNDTAYEFVLALTPSYTEFKWSEDLKTAVVQVISHIDEGIYGRVLHELAGLERHDAIQGGVQLVALVLMLFELHLDVYERVNNPNSVVEHRVRVETRRQLVKWFELAADFMSKTSRGRINEALCIRFLWASVCSIALGERVSQEHIIACWESMRASLLEMGGLELFLPNNAVTPEISTAAADREISKLTTMKFFLGFFSEDLGDPVSVIEMLEPVLNPDSVVVGTADNANVVAAGVPDDASHVPGQPISDCASQGLRDLWKFLRGSSTELRLFLWTKLGEAYGRIKYTTKQFSCLLRSVEMIITDFELDSYRNLDAEPRKELLVDMVNSLDDVVVAALQLALSDNDSFDIIDENHLRSSSSALAKLSCLLHVAAMFEDEVRIGMTSPPKNSATWSNFLDRLREMQVRAWCLLYTVLKVGIYQHKGMFPKPENDLADYLAAVHQVLGLRKCCKASVKIFLKMMRVELLKQENSENWEDYLGQVLYDLYGLKLGVGIWEVQDHACPPETLDRKQAIMLVGKIMMLATRMSMKDLLKSDLKTTIEHMQQAIGSTKSTSQMIHNLRNFTEYLKKPIHPLRLYQALQGNVSLDAITVNSGEGALAKMCWFFLLGMIALTRFKGVDLNRRQTPGATDDLRLGATFLRLQLQFTPDFWEAWYRLAECFDYELDEAVLWTADKMNKDRVELVKFQRSSIHCYTLALSHAHSPHKTTAGHEAEQQGALYDMYRAFGMRLYASSREPFAMEPFRHAEQHRYFIEEMGAGTFKKIIHEEMTAYKVWKFAANLFRRAMVGRPKDWKNPYMISKCLWKMYQQPLDTLDASDRDARPTVGKLIAALEKTVEVVSGLPKPRHGQDPVLEPHYKILSVVHKLVMRGDLSPRDGAAVLKKQPCTPQLGEDVLIEDKSDWEGVVVKCLRALRDRDKSNWQHRIIIRHARVLFAAHGSAGEADDADDAAAKAAFMVLRENMFTKTMVMNVWKCDAERPGRHHVFTEQYISLMVQVLAVLKDRANMEAVLRRIRKKGADFYHFNELWQSCVLTYLRLIRRAHCIPLTEEDMFKSLSPDEFEIVSERINEWATKPEADKHAGLQALKETIELKKLNANLLKATPVDDLVSDCYSFIYSDIGLGLPGPAPSEVIEERHRVKDEGLRVEGSASKPDGVGQNDRESTTLGSLRASPERLWPGEKMEKQVSSTGEPSHRSRRPGVRRPDILRKAEQVVLRAAEGPPKSAGLSGSGRKSRLGSASSGKNGTATANGRDAVTDTEDEDRAGGRGARVSADVEQHKEGEDTEMNDADGPAGLQKRRGKGPAVAVSVASSPPGSLHDSADDESDDSELSDVPADFEEDNSPSLMFPNLRKSADASVALVPTSSTASSAVGSPEMEDEEHEDVVDEEELEEGEGLRRVVGEDRETDEENDVEEEADEEVPYIVGL